MKVLFLKDVPKIGKKHEVKEVADGFAYNNLIPRKLVVLATPEHIRLAEAQQASLAHAREVKESRVHDIVLKTKESPLKIAVPANKEGHLFKGLRASDILSAIKKEYNIDLEEKDILLKNPLKEIGLHNILLKMGEKEAECTIIIEPHSK
ncbi:50S ribosomal protein L9 [Patescibacteria group bacterium]|nr:50S ribosomal protein L9 [Patescibacteria group bacterium]